MAGPGDCIQNAAGQCYWEIVTCPSISGYLRTIEASFCMYECSQYSIETEIDADFGSINVIPSDFILNDIDLYIDRFVEISLGSEVVCVECSAFVIEQINLSNDCQYPVECFQDPCLVEGCPTYPNAGCVSNFCGGCYADFYTSIGEFLTDCDSMEECVDLSDLFFGWCDMYLGVGYVDGWCQHLSGCGWEVDGVDYFDAFFESIDECEETCGGGNMACDEIADTYDGLHIDQYATCEFDNDCMAVWGDCDVGLGGCHYSVSVENYPADEIDTFVDLWLAGDCMSWVCDCAAVPYAQCIDGTCTSAYCMSSNPAGCNQTGCDEGYECVVDPGDCAPSWCDCDGFYGEWICTEDCGGGTCMETSLPGDLNDDGVINVMDIVLVVDAILHSEYDLMGDINSDGHLNVHDIVQLINLIIGT